MFDGIQRIYNIKTTLPEEFDQYLNKNLDLPEDIVSKGDIFLPFLLDKTIKYPFKPLKFKEGDTIESGDIFGQVEEDNEVKHFIMLPNNEKGIIKYLAKEGNYTIEEDLLELDCSGVKKTFKMYQYQELRKSRPVKEKLDSSMPVDTGIRYIDFLFPFRFGDVVSTDTNRKDFNYMLHNSKRLDMIIQNYHSKSNRDSSSLTPLLDYSSMTKNYVNLLSTDHFPLALQEISISTMLSISEYYRDMGMNIMVYCNLNPSLRALNIIEKEIQKKLTTYDEYFNTIQKRIGYSECIGSRKGSITLINFLEKNQTSKNVLQKSQTFWKDFINSRELFPIFPLYSKTNISIETLYKKEIPNYYIYRDFIMSVFQKEREIYNIYFGTDSILYDTFGSYNNDILNDFERFTLYISYLLYQNFLIQNTYAEYDKFSDYQKNYMMAKNFYEYYHQGVLLMQRFGLKFESIYGNREDLNDLTSQQFKSPPQDLTEKITSNFREIALCQSNYEYYSRVINILKTQMNLNSVRDKNYCLRMIQDSEAVLNKIDEMYNDEVKEQEYQSVLIKIKEISFETKIDKKYSHIEYFYNSHLIHQTKNLNEISSERFNVDIKEIFIIDVKVIDTSLNKVVFKNQIKLTDYYEGKNQNITLELLDSDIQLSKNTITYTLKLFNFGKTKLKDNYSKMKEDLQNVIKIAKYKLDEPQIISKAYEKYPDLIPYKIFYQESKQSILSSLIGRKQHISEDKYQLVFLIQSSSLKNLDENISIIVRKRKGQEIQKKLLKKSIIFKDNNITLVSFEFEMKELLLKGDELKILYENETIYHTNFI